MDRPATAADSTQAQAHAESPETTNGDQHLAEKTSMPSADEPSAPGTISPASSSADPEKSAAGPAALNKNSSPRPVHGIVWFFVVVSILSTTFLFALDNTIVAVVQPIIVETFHDVNKLPWLSVAFLVAAAGTNLWWGKMFAQFDAKILYLVTVLLFEIGSAICGAANKIDVLIFGRALCGFGGVGMYAGVMTLLAVNTTEHERPTYIGFTGICWGAGTVLGPIIGGALTSAGRTGWRWAFYLNLFVAAVAAPTYFFLLPRYDPRPGVPLRNRFTELDFVGTILICGAYVAGVMAVSFGGTTYAWSSGRVIALFVVSGVLFIIFAVQQGTTFLTTAARRIFPVPFLRSRTLILVFITTACGSTLTFVPIYFIPLFYQFARASTALSAGVHLLPFICLLIVSCVGNGAIMSATGYYMPWFLASGVLSLIGNALLYTVDVNTSSARIYGYSSIAGFGAGLTVQAGFSVAQASVDPALIPVAIGFITCGQIAGATIALAIANAVFLNGSVAAITKILVNEPLDQIQAAVAGAGSTLFTTLDPSQRNAVIAAIIENMQKVYILGIVAGSILLLSSLIMKREKLFLKASGGA